MSETFREKAAQAWANYRYDPESGQIPMGHSFLAGARWALEHVRNEVLASEKRYEWESPVANAALDDLGTRVELMIDALSKPATEEKTK